MDLNSLLRARKKNLKPTKTVLTNFLGEKYEISDGSSTKIAEKNHPFVVDNEPDLQVAEITPGLFLSSQDPIFCEDILRNFEIKHILSLGIEPYVKFNGIFYHFIEILDVPEFDLNKTLKNCIEIIESYHKENILVHCNAGVSRSPSVVIAYLMKCENLSFEEALKKVKLIRPCIKPNGGFIKQLKAFETQSKCEKD